MTPVAEILAKYKGAECKDEVVEEGCTGDCLLDKKTKLVLSISVPASVALSIVTTCLVIFCYHKCKKKPEENIEMEEFHGELNEEYGQYYFGDERMIKSEVQDTNDYYEETGEQ